MSGNCPLHAETVTRECAQALDGARPTATQTIVLGGRHPALRADSERAS
jgi:hypothetical protein